MPNDFVKSILGLTRKEYTANLEAWKRNELRFLAGDDVYEELRPFQWETIVQAADNQADGRTVSPGLASLTSRKDAAVCIEFASMTKEKFVGLVFQHFPTEERGGLSLGNLRGLDDGWRADALMRNADGTGKNARSAEAFWRDEMEMAMATRYRWLLAESPAGGAANRADEEENRPYFVGFSPTAVPYWYEDRGNLQCIRITLTSTRPQKGEDGIEDATITRHYLMTRRGFTGWGTAEDAGDPRFTFDQGGWWLVDDEGGIIEDGDAALFGDWEETGGDIPMAPLYYERGSPGSKDTGITHIGRIQVEFMNQLSAMLYSSWVGGSGVVFFPGADDEQWETIRNAGLFGGQWVPIPPKTNDTGNPSNVDVVSLAAFDASPAIKTSLDLLLKLAAQLIMRELMTSPDASGASRQMEFLQGNTPRLSNMAGNLEECMGTMHRFLEMRWGYPEPESSVKWTRHFDLRTTLEKIKGVFELMAVASAQSPTLGVNLMLTALKSEGFIPDGDEGDALEAEIKEELEAGVQRQVQEQDTLAQFGL